MSIIGVHNVIIIGTTNGCIFSVSCSTYAFHPSIFSAQQEFSTSYFCRTILGLAGKISSWLKINKQEGVAIRLSWCAFFDKINSRGDIYSRLESRWPPIHETILQIETRSTTGITPWTVLYVATFYELSDG